MQPAITLPQSGGEIVDSKRRGRNPMNKKASQDWTLVKQKLYFVKFASPFTNEENKEAEPKDENQALQTHNSVSFT